ncbi:IS30 family transposase [Leucobacter sp. Psy1]|nr:IS30 family transposase [Leucobacter sp. Psy1]
MDTSRRYARRADLTDAERSPGRAYHRLGLEERVFIETALGMEPAWSYRRIARHLGVNVSTVSREVRRHPVTRPPLPNGNAGSGGSRYHAVTSQYRTMLLRRSPRTRKLDDTFLRALVADRLNAKCSPQQVAGRLRVEFPDSPELWVSHETIYQALYVQGAGALRHELTVEKALRSGRTGRIPQSKLPARTRRPWLDGAHLLDRPAEVADRAVPGHWEGDLVVGPGNSGLVTLVERQTRFALIGRLPGVRDSATVVQVMQEMVEGLPGELRKTVTWDQGVEMARHAEFTVATGCRVFFCDPHSPWQRGSNENLNGLIRDFYPKGTNFNGVSDGEIAQVQELLNGRPRQTLGFYTPRERLDELISGVALAP